MKVKCPSCEERIDINVNEFEEGDNFDCPECNSEYILKVKSGKFVLKPESSKYDNYSLEEYYDES
ncbi:MAG TPA: hypothetical protein VJK05_03100 [archaeon]|nr:hypothetical protein [archaeon]